MGRNYWGDIEGKFWLGVQSSHDAEFFGGTMAEPRELEYRFGDIDLARIERGLARCLDKLGKRRAALDAYFKDNDGYTDAALAQHLATSKDKLAKILAWYARLLLGEKIHAKIKETGDCTFTAEC